MALEGIEQFIEDPLAIFDLINTKIWKDPSDVNIKRVTANVRSLMETEESVSEKYELLVGYIGIAKIFSRGVVQPPAEMVKETLPLLEGIEKAMEGNYTIQ